TRQYIDPVRYLTNASSGRMGAALAQACMELGHEVVVVSGPVEVKYPKGARVVPVTSTEEMLVIARDAFDKCDGLIGAAAPCDYRPRQVEPAKIAKTGEPLLLKLIETEDVVATLAAEKGHRWVVGFALETEDHRLRALAKLERKRCDLMVSNGVEAMHAIDNSVEVLDAQGTVIQKASGPKENVAREILEVIQSRLIEPVMN
ncbi:MAG: phosphopantothenoylcysteine decarboxylase, partial [Lacipirellulaceae bacterium]